MEYLQELQRYIFLILAVVVLLLVLKDLILARIFGVKFITAAEAYEIRRNNIFLDIRTPREIKKGQVIKGSKTIPLAELSKRIGEVKPTDKGVVIVCRSGSRAPAAGVKIKRAGVENVYVLKGGIIGWKRAGYFSKYKNKRKKKR